ncbi:hypothetical protein [Pyrodictium abyssi]|uniref:Uncharacterized protein n=1 Tax=Pyrodictium abyssi TaxID=54256 RepID=A0ABN6ZJT3_9CREN|nr:hypothetical protein PABY_00870 [Pyrodictium abyssi]
MITGVSGVELAPLLRLAEELGAATAKYEEFVEEEFKAPIYHVAELLLVDYRRTAERFEKAFRRMLDSLSGSEAAVVAAHAAYYRRSNIVASPLTGFVHRLAARGEASVAIVDYVDDYYHILYRLADRVARGETPEVAGFQVLDPAGLLYWRSTHHSIAQLAAIHGVEFYVYASKHSREGHQRLLAMLLGMEPDGGGSFHTVYVSHPITRVRARALQEGAALDRYPDALEIEEFKKTLEESCPSLVVFSPTTVDELITDPATGRLKTRIERSERWPHGENGLHEYPYPVDLRDRLFDLHLYPVEDTTGNPGYMSYLQSQIEASIERRDLGYVAQADMIVAYRPTMYGETHMGVETEIKTAVAMAKPVYSVVPREERSIAYRLFRFEYPLSSIDELLSVLRCPRR